MPVNALLLMAIPSIIVSLRFYALPALRLVQLTYDATLGIAAMFFVSGLAFMVMPWRANGDLGQLGAAEDEDRGHPGPSIAALDLRDLHGLQHTVPLVLDKANVYGVGYKNKNSMIFMGILYVAAIVDLGRRLGRAQASGHGARGRGQGDPGRVIT